MQTIQVFKLHKAVFADVSVNLVLSLLSELLSLLCYLLLIYYYPLHTKHFTTYGNIILSLFIIIIIFMHITY